MTIDEILYEFFGCPYPSYERPHLDGRKITAVKKNLVADGGTLIIGDFNEEVALSATEQVAIQVF